MLNKSLNRSDFVSLTLQTFQHVQQRPGKICSNSLNIWFNKCWDKQTDAAF